MSTATHFTARPRDPLATYRAASSAQNPSPFIAGRAQQSLRTPEYPPAMTTARQIVTDFLKARVAANNARLTFILDQTPENLTAWVNADAALDDLHDADYYPATPGTPLEGAS